MATEPTKKDDTDLVVRDYDRVDMFINTGGDLVFSRSSHEWEGDGPTVAIIIPRASVKAVSKRMLEVLKESARDFGGAKR